MSDETRKQRVFSGVQPSGGLHIGNYVGALSQWRDILDTHDCTFCIVDLHALTVPENIDPAALRAKSRELSALYIACGIDPGKATIFIQSEVRAHAELAWVLSCTTPLSWLHKMTQFKSKADTRESVGTGLLTYPVLQAADILLYDTDVVPVGEDQVQHIELARDIAARFNHMFGDTFVVPRHRVRAAGARIMGLDDPTAKMSKSANGSGHAIYQLDPPKKVKKAIMRAKTDTGSEFRPAHAGPGVRNLLTIFSVLTGEDAATIGARYAGRGYGYLKKDLVEAVEATVAPIRAEYARITDDPGELDRILDAGAARARAIATP
ncbi:MAG: tryptophan--tRNA ligase, partial [Myxococcota bacterium]|nr:tryptophan--tRNA ligase [Myxococcota bacterium]